MPSYVASDKLNGLWEVDGDFNIRLLYHRKKLNLELDRAGQDRLWRDGQSLDCERRTDRLSVMPGIERYLTPGGS
jgi:hypothetical protein